MRRFTIIIMVLISMFLLASCSNKPDAELEERKNEFITICELAVSGEICMEDLQAYAYENGENEPNKMLGDVMLAIGYNAGNNDVAMVEFYLDYINTYDFNTYSDDYKEYINTKTQLEASLG